MNKPAATARNEELVDVACQAGHVLVLIDLDSRVATPLPINETEEDRQTWSSWAISPSLEVFK
jgi:hypothetical protein